MLKTLWKVAAYLTLPIELLCLFPRSTWAQEAPLLLAGKQARLAKAGTIYRVAVSELRPLQLAYGPKEVAFRLTKFRRKDAKKRLRFFEKKSAKIIVGPAGEIFLLDGHHLARMLLEAKESHLNARVVEVAQESEAESFFARLEAEGKIYRYDVATNRKIPLSDLPKSISELKVEPLRDIAWALEKSNDIEDVAIPFIEFEWARLLFRNHFSAEQVREKFDETIIQARTIAHGSSAKTLFTNKGFISRSLGR